MTVDYADIYRNHAAEYDLLVEREDYQGHLDAAWDDFQDLLATGQYRMDALYYLGRIADYRDEHDRAIRLYREVNARLSRLMIRYFI